VIYRSLLHCLLISVSLSPFALGQPLLLQLPSFWLAGTSGSYSWLQLQPSSRAITPVLTCRCSALSLSSSRHARLVVDSCPSLFPASVFSALVYWCFALAFHITFVAFACALSICHISFFIAFTLFIFLSISLFMAQLKLLKIAT
jgi:hypothetical protein